MRYAQLVMGPAGCGKSTYCNMIAEHGIVSKRMIHVVNLDPAAENFLYKPTIDVRDLISLSDVQDDDELRLGPNGGLVFCMEFLVENFDWLAEQLGEVEDDYLVFDCPGQIELYTHMPVMSQLVTKLHKMSFTVCGVFLLDSQFLVEVGKFMSGSLVALSAMVNLEIPHINVLSKIDLLNKKSRNEIERYLDPDIHLLEDMAPGRDPWREKYQKLSCTIANLLSDYSLVKFVPLDISDEESVETLMLQVDMCIQYGEDMEPRERFPEDRDPDHA